MYSNKFMTSIFNDRFYSMIQDWKTSSMEKFKTFSEFWASIKWGFSFSKLCHFKMPKMLLLGSFTFRKGFKFNLLSLTSIWKPFVDLKLILSIYQMVQLWIPTIRLQLLMPWMKSLPIMTIIHPMREKVSFKSIQIMFWPEISRFWWNRFLPHPTWCRIDQYWSFDGLGIL